MMISHRSSRITMMLLAIALITQGLAMPAAACYPVGPPFFPQDERVPYNGSDFLIGQDTLDANTRGIHGGIGIAAGTPNPDPLHATLRNKIAVMLQSKQISPVNGRGIWSAIGWQMGYLLTLPGGQNTYADSPTIFFEGIDNVADYRDVIFGFAETLGEYETSWAGAIGSHWKYNGWYKQGGVWYIAGYAELDAETTIATAQGEASDVPEGRCLKLSFSNTSLHEEGTPVALRILIDTWHVWTTAYPHDPLPDNARPYVFTQYRLWDQFGVGGLGNQ
jgi:hypothetical protein